MLLAFASVPKQRNILHSPREHSLPGFPVWSRSLNLRWRLSPSPALHPRLASLVPEGENSSPKIGRARRSCCQRRKSGSLAAAPSLSPQVGLWPSPPPARACRSLGVRQLRLRLRERRWASRRLQQETSPPTDSTPSGSLASQSTRGRGGKGGGKPGPASSTAPGGAWPQQAPPTPRARPPGNRHNTTKWPLRCWTPRRKKLRVSSPPRPAGLLRSAPWR